MNGNDFVKFFLHTPLNGLLGDTLLINFKGRKTGKEYSTPVGYFREDGDLWVLSSRDRTWWRNLRGGAEVTLLMHGKTICAFAEAVMDEKEVEQRLINYVQHIPISARSMGIRVESNNPNVEDVNRVAQERLFVRIHPMGDLS